MHVGLTVRFGRLACQSPGAARDLNVVAPRLFINHDADYDWLIALEFGLTDDGQPSENWRPLGDDMGYLVVEGELVGFVVRNWADFDPHDPDYAAIWEPPTFAAPVLGLHAATAG